MKKIYQTPTAEVIRIETTQMMASSPTTLGIGDPVSDASGAEARELFIDGEY